MTGAILVVSGPTVVGPLLAFVRPADRLQRILSWEGSLIDPVGGILGAVVFHAVLASTHGGLGHPVGQFLLSLGIGAAGAAAGVAVLPALPGQASPGRCAQRQRPSSACVVAVAAVCDIVRDDAGLIAAILMGLAVANLRAFDLPARRPFFETLVKLIIGVLFVCHLGHRHPPLPAAPPAAYPRPGGRPGARRPARWWPSSPLSGPS